MHVVRVENLVRGMGESLVQPAVAHKARRVSASMPTSLARSPRVCGGATKVLLGEPPGVTPVPTATAGDLALASCDIINNAADEQCPRKCGAT